MNGLNLLIVGGGAGLGALLARLVVAEGAKGVGVIDLDGTAADQSLAAARDVGIAATAVQGDISTGAGAHAAFSTAAEGLGRIDTLINAAAIYPRKPLMEITDTDWDAFNAVNVKGSYHMMVAAARHMGAREPSGQVRGRIVNITSVDAFKAHPQNAHYAATKAAVVSLTRSFAQELAPQGILVNSVAPAGMATDRARAAGFLNELSAASPLGRGGTLEEMAEWVLMAGGPKNTYMTGENIIVSGGYIYA